MVERKQATQGDYGEDWFYVRPGSSPATQDTPEAFLPLPCRNFQKAEEFDG